MEEIDQKLDQWIHNSIIRAEVRKVIEDYILDQKVDAFKAGWLKGQQVNLAVDKLIDKNK